MKLATVLNVGGMNTRYRGAIIERIGSKEELVDECRYARDNIADARKDAMDLANDYANCELDW